MVDERKSDFAIAVFAQVGAVFPRQRVYAGKRNRRQAETRDLSELSMIAAFNQEHRAWLGQHEGIESARPIRPPPFRDMAASKPPARERTQQLPAGVAFNVIHILLFDWFIRTRVREHRGC